MVTKKTTGGLRPTGSHLDTGKDRMSTANRSETLEFLRGRRGEIADGWYRAVAPTDFTALTAAEVRRCLAELSNRAVDLLFSEPFERREARELGSALAGMHYLSPEALRGTQEELARRLLQHSS